VIFTTWWHGYPGTHLVFCCCSKFTHAKKMQMGQLFLNKILLNFKEQPHLFRQIFHLKERNFKKVPEF
jgi:hypothetical protein